MNAQWEIAFNEVADRVKFLKESFLHKIRPTPSSKYYDEAELMLWVRGGEIVIVIRIIKDRRRWLIGVCELFPVLELSFQ